MREKVAQDLARAYAELRLAWTYLDWPPRGIPQPFYVWYQHDGQGVPARRLPHRGPERVGVGFWHKQFLEQHRGNLPALVRMLELEHAELEAAAQLLRLDVATVTWEAVVTRHTEVSDTWLAYCARTGGQEPPLAYRDVRVPIAVEFLSRYVTQQPSNPATDGAASRASRTRGRLRLENDRRAVRAVQDVDDRCAAEDGLTKRAACSRVGISEDTYYETVKRLRAAGRYPVSPDDLVFGAGTGDPAGR